MNVSGVLLGPEPILYSHEEASSDGEEPEGDETGVQSSTSHLKEALAQSRMCNEKLEAAVSSLSGELSKVRIRVNELWRKICAQVVVFEMR